MKPYILIIILIIIIIIKLKVISISYLLLNLPHLPRELDDVVGDYVPGLAEVLGEQQLLAVDAGHLLLSGALVPAGRQHPILLGGVELELVQHALGVDRSHVGAAVLRHPVDSLGAEEDYQVGIHRARDHLEHVASLREG